MAENKKPAKIGLMTGAVDSLIFASKWTHNQNQLVFFAPKGKVEEKWAKSFLPLENVVCYNLKDKNISMAVLDLDGVVKNSDITKKLKNLGVEFFLLHHSASKFLNDWQNKSKVKLISSGFKWRKLEDKIFFDNFLAKNKLPKPESEIYFWGKPKIKIRGRAVLQDPNSEGGEGTYFVNDMSEITNLFSRGKLKKKNRYLLRKYIDGQSFGITVLSSPCTIGVSAIRTQCYGEKNFSNRRQFFGVQWVSAKELGLDIKLKIEKVFFSLAESLKKIGFFGYANIDFIIGNDGNIYIIECNPRFSASTSQLVQFPEIIGGLNTTDVYFDYFLGNHNSHFSKRYSGLMSSKFQGSVLHLETPNLKKSYLIKREYRNGIYKFEKGKINFLTPDITDFDTKGSKFIFYSDTSSGESIEKDTVIGLVISNFPLYTKSGIPKDKMKVIINKFSLV